MQINDLIARHARYRPNHVAFVCGDLQLTWRELNARVNRAAHALLGLGIGKGDKVATLLPNCPELIEIYWACAKIGAVVVPMSTLLRGKGLITLLNDSDTTLVVTDPTHAAVVAAILPELPALHAGRVLVTEPSPSYALGDYHALCTTASESNPTGITIHDDDPYNIMYSSGTTGLPKGIVLTHAVRAAYCTLYAAAYRIRPESVILHGGALVFNGAFLTLMPWIFLGTTYVLMRQFDPQALIELVQHYGVTHIKMVPSQIVALLQKPQFNQDDLPTLEMIGSVGAPLHLEHKQELQRRLPQRLYELYGLTEGFMTVLDRDDLDRKLGSVGVPTPFQEIRIIGEDGQELPVGEVGEIVGRGAMLMQGYYKRPDLTAQAIVDGWLRSGDMGYVDADGFLYLVDRKKDLIISGGVNVYPRDIEEIIVQHPAVREAAVFGVPSEKWGETPLAAVVLREAGLISAEELREWVNARVEAGFQKISAVEIMSDFPRNAAGKTLKRELRDRYWQGREAKI
ncbi:MAG: class I adenylate-forming enzyme family protein [Roseiflexaceae bacterium]